MKTKAKKFSHKLLALFMALVMVLTCFGGALSAFAASSDVSYVDDAVDYNSLAWSVLSDEQTATALLDYADEMLAEYGPTIDKLLANLLPSSGMYYYEASTRRFRLSVAGIIKNDVDIHVHSVNEVIHTLESVNNLIEDRHSVIGTLGSLCTSTVSGMTRENTSSCDIIEAIIGLLQKNFSSYNGGKYGKDPLGDILRGDFTLGTLGTFLKLDLYGIIGDLVGGTQDGYESDFVYNLVQALIFNNTDWYTDAEKNAFYNDPSTFVYDTELLEKLTTELLDKISVLVTYDQEFNITNGEGEDLTETKVQDTSATRYKEIKAKMNTGDGMTYAEAAAALGYDPNLVYSDEFTDAEGNYKNILLFAYGSPDENGLATDATDKIVLNTSSSLFSFGLQALDMAWDTVLSGTVKLLHVNYDVERGHGSNFDNAYYYWVQKQEQNENNTYSWDNANPANNYTGETGRAMVEAWMTDVYEAYGASDMEEFKGWVQHDFEFDRTTTNDSEGKWSDIDAKTLFNKVRYSPLADMYFNMETGPINLYFMQLGSPNLDAFFKDANYRGYSSLVAGLNDALVAAVQDIFVSSSNIIGTVPEMRTTGDIATIDDSAIKNTIVPKLIANALDLVEYTANAIDADILKAFHANHPDTALSESNLEEAMLPLLIACIGRINLGSGKLAEVIHPEDWNACTNAEAVIYLCLREYLSYILPNKDYDFTGVYTKNADGSVTINATLDNSILKMARDAVVYVMQGYVPVSDVSGANWNVYDRPVNDDATLLELLNSVVAYYGGEYTVTTDGNRAMAVGALIGICDSSTARSTIVMGDGEEQLWRNIDAVVNKVFPVIGVLQYGDTSKYGLASSKDLIWNDIVLGALDIADTSIHSSGLCGVSNILYKFLTIVSSEPIQTTAISITIYNVLADLINGLFGARYNGQGYKYVAPYCTSGTTIDPTSKYGSDCTVSTSTPFDNLFHKAQLVGNRNGDAGAFHKLVDNFTEFFGYGTSGVNTYNDSMMPGIAFALKAVQSFIPEAIFNLGDHELKLATAEFANTTHTAVSTGANKTETVSIKNESAGVNNAYVDGLSDTNVQLSRYWLNVKSAVPSAENGATCSVTTPATTPVAPGKELSVTFSYTFTSNTSYKVVFTYDITDGENGPVLYSDLTATAYLYATSDTSWKDVVYPQDVQDRENGWISGHLEPSSAASSKTYNGYTAYTSNKGLTGSVGYVTYPEYFVLESTKAGDISGYMIRTKNDGSKDRGMDGFYIYETNKSVVDDGSNGASVTLTQDHAKAICDPETGDLLKYERYDYRIGDGAWSRVSVPFVNNEESKTSDQTYNAGYSSEEIGNIYDGLTDAQKKQFETRDCHAITLAEAISYKMVRAYHKNEKTNLYEYVYIQPSDENSISYGWWLSGGTLYPHHYDHVLSTISMAGPVDGLYIPSGKITLQSNKSQYMTLFAYDGKTEIQAGSYPVQVCAYSGGGSMLVGTSSSPCTLVVVDTTSKDAVDSKYKELADLMANYEPTDFSDYNSSTGKSATYNYAEDALIQALEAKATVITPTNGDRLSDKRHLVASTETTTSAYGDIAYLPFMDEDESAIPAKLLATATLGSDSVYYVDSACTIPLLSNVEYATADLEDGDVEGVYLGYAGEKIVMGDDGKYHLQNEPLMDGEWDTNTFNYPWWKDTTTQSKNNDNKLLYKQITFVYRDANGNKVNSDDVDSNGNLKWVAKLPATENAIITNVPGGTDNRGVFTQAKDLLSYTIDQVYAHISTATATELFTNITKDRTGLNINNFEVITFNKMVSAAQAAEKKFSVTISYTNNEGKDENYTLKPTEAVSNLNWIATTDDKKVVGVTPNVEINSSLSSVQCREYQRLYEFYLGKVVERGYLGTQLEKEILCASGNAYNTMTATPATYNEDGTLATAAVITKTTAGTAEYGVWDASGNLVNEGETVYSQLSWDRYVNALAEAINLAQTGVSTATNSHKTASYYVSDDDYVAQNSKCYSVDTELQKAEIALTPLELVGVTVSPVEGATVSINGVEYTAPMTFEKGETISVALQLADNYEYDGYLTINGDKVYTGLPYSIYLDEDVVIAPAVTYTAPAGFTVSGKVTIANTLTGGDSGFGLGGIDVIANGVVVATSASDGTFTTTPLDETVTTLVFHRDNVTIDREVAVTGVDVTGAVIPVVMADYSGDTFVDNTDLGMYLLVHAKSYDVYCDYTADGFVDGTDLGMYLVFHGKTITYAALEF